MGGLLDSRKRRIVRPKASVKGSRMEPVLKAGGAGWVGVGLAGYASSFVIMRVDRATATAQGCGGLFVIPFTLHKHRRHLSACEASALSSDEPASRWALRLALGVGSTPVTTPRAQGRRRMY